MYFKTLCVLLSVATIANAVNFQKCDSDPSPVSVNVENCNDEYCEVKRSTPANMELTFKPTVEATQLTGSINALVAGSWFPWPLGRAGKVCDHLKNGEGCPVAAGKEATYGVSMKIPFIAPVGTKVTVQLKVTDQNKAVVACTRFPVLVVA